MLRSKAYKIADAKFPNWEREAEGGWTFDDMKNDGNYAGGWISLTSILNDEANRRIYVGIGSFDNNLLYAFDRENRSFADLQYRSVAEPYDAKFHCSLEIDDNGDIYGGLAQFHDLDKQFAAMGGRLVRYTPSLGRYDFWQRRCAALTFNRSRSTERGERFTALRCRRNFFSGMI